MHIERALPSVQLQLREQKVLNVGDGLRPVNVQRLLLATPNYICEANSARYSGYEILLQVICNLNFSGSVEFLYRYKKFRHPHLGGLFVRPNMAAHLLFEL